MAEHIDSLERRFNSFLEATWAISDIKAFLLTYIRLLLMFKAELPPEVLGVILERQRQLRGERFDDDRFDEVRALSLGALSKDFPDRAAALHRLILCSLLDTEETDFFYLTEPMFAFVRVMDVPSIELTETLESEFVGFREAS